MTLLDRHIIEYLQGMMAFHGGYDWGNLTYWQDQGYLDACTITLFRNKGPYREPF